MAGGTLPEERDNLTNEERSFCSKHLTSGGCLLLPIPQGLMNLIFEVADLAVASPATVSRCGMVYVQVGECPGCSTWEYMRPQCGGAGRVFSA